MDNIKFQFVDLELNVPNKKQTQPAAYLRQSFNVDVSVKRATLYTTALGVYIPYFNGSKMSEQQLLPGFTDYKKRVQYLTCDITDRIKQGKNTIAAIVADGWYRGALGAGSDRCLYGDKIKFAATVKLEYENDVQWIYTDDTAKACSNGPITASDIKTDEIVDMNKEIVGWNEVDFDDASWHNCMRSSYDGSVVPQEGELLLEQEHFKAKVLHTPNGETVLDFGQNMSGHISFQVSGKAGHTVKILLGETLDENGNFTQRNVSVDDGPNSNGVLGAMMQGRFGQTLTYTLKEGEQTYKAHFLVSGFRYAKLVDWPEKVEPENFEAIAIYSDLKETGSFSCSNPKINQFVSNVKWSWKSNSVDIPTDCPQRERAGWTGDINVFAETACWHTDIEKFIHKWLKDFVGMQRESGSLPHIIPECGGGDFSYSSAGWCDAIINVPMTLYQFYGDTEAFEIVYDATKKFIEFNLNRAKKRNFIKFYRRETWYQYVLDTGYHWGEWLEPGANMLNDLVRAFVYSDAEVATAWLYHTIKQFSEVAGILGKTMDQQKYAKIALNVRDAYRKEFMKDGKVNSKRQCRYVRPLFMGLAEKEEVAEIATTLNEMVIENNYKIGTGFLTTYKILQTLTDYGYSDTAYKMMEQENCPGWLYEVTKGATTTWESWEAVKPDGTISDVSQNHFAPGAACAWLFSHVGGIQPLEPGFTKIRIKPIPGGTLTYAKTAFISRQGKIVSNWAIENGSFMLHVEIPSGVNAEIVLTDGTMYEVGEGTYDYGSVTFK